MAADQPNVLFLFSDEHSFRYLGHREEAAGGEPVSTPTLDTLAANGTTFDRTYCQMPLCTPSRLCTLTGRRADRCGAYGNNNVLEPGQATLPGTFSEAGYDTTLVGKMHFGGNRQFCGFDNRPYGDLTGGTGHQADPPAPEQRNGLAMRSRTADAGVTEIPESLLQEYTIVRESLSHLREHRHERPDQPWLLNASFSRPHFPLTAPQRFLDRYWPEGVTEPPIPEAGDAADHPLIEGMVRGFQTDAVEEDERQLARAAYFACVEFLDDIIGEFLTLLEADGFLENTIVVYASDHGEYAGEHGLWWKHGYHEAASRVPMIVQTPGHRDGSIDAHQIDTPVGLIDLFPTLCGLSDIDVPDGLDGYDLTEAVRTGTEPERKPVVCDNLTPRWGKGTQFRAVIDGTNKYVHFKDAPGLGFDLETDPEEQHNIADDEAFDELRSYAEASIDFDAVARDRAAALERKETEYGRAYPRGSGNCYLMPDGTVVDADTPLYRQHVITEDPATAYDDFPGGDAR